MRIRLLKVTLALLSLLLFIGLLPIHGEAEIYDSVVRLHILANSDSEEDQALKLKVRDAILAYTVPLLEGIEDRDAAIGVLSDHLQKLKEIAEEVTLAEGSGEAVTVTFDEEEYPERSYDGLCFPSGSYLSLRVCIGEAEGHNWWCCLFPPLCLGAATVSKSDAEEELVSVGLTPSQYRIITESDKTVYKIRFRILEWFS